MRDYEPLTEPRPHLDPPSLALPVAQAAASLGLGEKNLRRDVLPQVRSIKLDTAADPTRPTRPTLIAPLYLDGSLTHED